MKIENTAFNIQYSIFNIQFNKEHIMRRFSSYGQIDTELHYYAPRTALIEHAYTQLMGENPEKGGHYITVWAPRQTGKSGTMLQIRQRLTAMQEF
ncbi:MAG: hypothetical protein GY797_35925, partial [Deltaproteobacteria bacterium]|nr:hypothetical protein [Deltaproteobacteria bacterium]